MRALAIVMENVETIAVMTRLADDYEIMADRAEERSRGISSREILDPKRNA